MKIIYVAHPIAGNIKGNLQKIKQIVRDINLNHPHIVPFAPYWLDCHALDDTILAERVRGIKNDHEYFRRKVMDEVWVYGEHLSNGVKAEIELAIKLGIPVIVKSEWLKGVI